MNRYNITEEQIKIAVSESSSIAQALKKLGVVAQGGNYKVFHRAIKKYNIDTSHFIGQAHNRGKSFGYKKPINEYLTVDSTISSHHLRVRLIKENIFKSKCSNCNLTNWLENKIPLELDHINGINTDNRLNNLRLLCPNCHALTSTYRGKNKGQYPKR